MRFLLTSLVVVMLLAAMAFAVLGVWPARTPAAQPQRVLVKAYQPSVIARGVDLR